ncbi:putative NLR family CARD domain-containing protein 4 [Apostichopus japonicus]|uniref:Putative NLR family CARD domain-containing protein 4 n=1 Tax=Stichopus japonicus TaxID=307972 RepID=A0A2G8JEA3_STIJA|nr:putative NLR family CARD domain-containing protein 4 [Apostichopus japonicus]
MENRSSRRTGSKRETKPDTTPGANQNSPRQPLQSEAPAQQSESIPLRETPASLLSLTNINIRASDEQTTAVRKKYSDPLTIDDKKQILIDGLKEKYKVHYDAVKPIPYIQDRLYCVNNIFVESGVVALIGSATSSGPDASWEHSDSYKDIFNDPRRRSNRRIIEGEPGYGKSTLTLQLAYDWCNGVQDSSLAEVEILILLRLRQLVNVPSIYKAIKRFLVPKEHRVQERDIKEILESCKSVAFQLDGYDEYQGRDTKSNGEESDVERIIMSKMFQESDVTLTTRYLPREYDEAKFKRFKLTGFDETARDEYIRKAVCGDDEQAIAKVKKGLRENVILDDLCQIPLFFSMFSHMTHEIEGFQKFKSVTDFLRYAMHCFHSHTRNKSNDFNTKEYSKFFETIT